MGEGHGSGGSIGVSRQMGGVEAPTEGWAGGRDAQGAPGGFRSLSRSPWDEGQEAEMEKCPFKNQWKCQALGAGLCLEIAAVCGAAAEAPIIVLFFSSFLSLSPAALQ